MSAKWGHSISVCRSQTPKPLRIDIVRLARPTYHVKCGAGNVIVCTSPRTTAACLIPTTDPDHQSSIQATAALTVRRLHPALASLAILFALLAGCSRPHQGCGARGECPGARCRRRGPATGLRTPRQLRCRARSAAGDPRRRPGRLPRRRTRRLHLARVAPRQRTGGRSGVDIPRQAAGDPEAHRGPGQPCRTGAPVHQCRGFVGTDRGLRAPAGAAGRLARPARGHARARRQGHRCADQGEPRTGRGPGHR